MEDKKRIVTMKGKELNLLGENSKQVKKCPTLKLLPMICLK